MTNYTIKVHSEGYTPKKPHLFAQSKGFNAGRPMKNPIPNCFVITLETEDDAMKMFFMLDGMWRSQMFRRQLIGSVIPFIRVSEFSKTIRTYWGHIHSNDRMVNRLVSAFEAIDKVQKEIEKMSKFLDDYKAIAYRNILKTPEIKPETETEFSN